MYLLTAILFISFLLFIYYFIIIYLYFIFLSFIIFLSKKKAKLGGDGIIKGARIYLHNVTHLLTHCFYCTYTFILFILFLLFILSFIYILFFFLLLFYYKKKGEAGRGWNFKRLALTANTSVVRV